jgi:hypothetical protein
MRSTAPERHICSAISKALLAGVGLGDEQLVEAHAEVRGVLGIEGVLGVDDRGDAALGLHRGDGVQGEGRLAAGLGAVDLDHTPPGQAADAQRDVEAQRARRDGHARLLGDAAVEAHHRAGAVLLVERVERRVEGLELVGVVGGLGHHGCLRCLWVLLVLVGSRGDDARAAVGGPSPRGRRSW